MRHAVLSLGMLAACGPAFPTTSDLTEATQAPLQWDDDAGVPSNVPAATKVTLTLRVRCPEEVPRIVAHLAHKGFVGPVRHDAEEVAADGDADAASAALGLQLPPLRPGEAQVLGYLPVGDGADRTIVRVKLQRHD